MSDVVSRPSLISDLTELASLGERLTLPPRVRAGWSSPSLDAGAAALIVLVAAAACYHFGMRLLAQWQWQ